MAGVVCSVNAAEIALVAATPKTVLGLKCAANHKIKLLAWGVYFSGVVVTDTPIDIELHRDTNATAHTGAALPEVKYDADQSVTIQTISTSTITANTTDGGFLQTIHVHPQAGYEKSYVPGHEPIFGGGAVAGCYWVVTAAAGNNVCLWAEWEE